MCILFLYVNSCPRRGHYRLVVASNRDEYYNRLSSPFRMWSDGVYGGQDLEGGFDGGTWLGVSTRPRTFKLGALLNLTGEHRVKGAPGRGAIVSNFLTGGRNAHDYIDGELGNGDYNAFNFVAVELSDETFDTTYYCNRPNTKISIAGQDYLGFGNSTYAVPLKKVQKGRERFERIIEANRETNDQTALVELLLDLLRWTEKHLPDDELTRRAEFASDFLSSIFVDIPNAGYGTRAHTIVLVDFDWNVRMVELATVQPSMDNKNWSRTTLDTKL